jgi:hypothetical protein
VLERAEPTLLAAWHLARKAPALTSRPNAGTVLEKQHQGIASAIGAVAIGSLGTVTPCVRYYFVPCPGPPCSDAAPVASGLMSTMCIYSPAFSVAVINHLESE